MIENVLMSCARDLSIAWKRHFGLGTQYVGYLSSETMLSFMSVCRYSVSSDFDSANPDGFQKRTNQRIRELNEEGMDIPELQLNKEQYKVTPDLLKVLQEYKTDIGQVSDDEWDQFVQYMES